jgi:tRNA(fMet)-specific endonuclease VapC
MNRVLVDTDILSYYFKGDTIVVQNFNNYLRHFDLIEISLITYYEIISGLMAKDSLKQLEIFYDFVTGNLIVPMTEDSAKISSELYSFLRKTGNTIDDIDLFIAGIAIENEMVLATNNEKHFGRIPNLSIQNWKNQLY